MRKIKPEDKEKISILAMEYGSLRGHINARISSIVQLIAVSVAIAALFPRPFAAHIIIIEVIIVLVLSVFVLLVLDIIEAGKQVQRLEAKINLCANEKLLIWETELGGLLSFRRSVRRVRCLWVRIKSMLVRCGRRVTGGGKGVRDLEIQ